MIFTKKCTVFPPKWLNFWDIWYAKPAEFVQSRTAILSFQFFATLWNINANIFMHVSVSNFVFRVCFHSPKSARIFSGSHVFIRVSYFNWSSSTIFICIFSTTLCHHPSSPYANKVNTVCYTLCGKTRNSLTLKKYFVKSHL